MRTLKRRSEATQAQSTEPETPAAPPLRKRSEATSAPASDTREVTPPLRKRSEAAALAGLVAATAVEPPLRKRSEATKPTPTPDDLPASWGGTPEPPPPMFARATPAGIEEQQWEQLAEQVHDVGDPLLRYKEMHRQLDVDAEQTWRANPLIRAKLATDARALHLAAKLSAKRRELDRTQIEAAAKKLAREALQDEANRGDRKGVISLAEIEARVALDHADEYRAWELAKMKDKGLVEFLETFANNLSQTIRGGGSGT